MNKALKSEILYTLLIAYLIATIMFVGYAFKSIIGDKSSEIQPDKVIYIHDMPKTEVKTETKVKTITKFVPVKTAEQPETVLSEDDKQRLAKVVHAEAGNQDDIGRRLVADVILNRMDSARFPETVSEVISQDGQFQTGKTFTEDDMFAVEMELKERLDHEVIWFKTGSYHKIGKSLYQHGDHYFSGE